MEALYGHYAKTYELWKKEGVRVPPLFHYCSATTQLPQKLVYDLYPAYCPGE